MFFDYFNNLFYVVVLWGKHKCLHLYQTIDYIYKYIYIIHLSWCVSFDLLPCLAQNPFK